MSDEFDEASARTDASNLTLVHPLAVFYLRFPIRFHIATGMEQNAWLCHLYLGRPLPSDHTFEAPRISANIQISGNNEAANSASPLRPEPANRGPHQEKDQM